MKLKFWQRTLKPQDFFTKDQFHSITETVKKAESLTAGEIRVVIRGSCKRGLSAKQQALADFQEHGLTQTRDNTGVLMLILLQNRQIELLADKGINDIIEKDFLDSVVLSMTNNFKNKEFCKGICEAVEMVGQVLAKHFPRKSEDTNELPNEPILAP